MCSEAARKFISEANQTPEEELHYYCRLHQFFVKQFETIANSISKGLFQVAVKNQLFQH